MYFRSLGIPESLSVSLSRNQDQAKLPSLQEALTSLQTQCSSFLGRINPDSLISHLQSSFPNLHWPSPSAVTSPAWASVTADGGAKLGPVGLSGARRGAMSVEDIEERLAGVPVYALSNSAEEFVLVSGVSTNKSLGLFCFREEDAEALLEQMKSMDPGMRSGSRVVPVALNKVLFVLSHLLFLFLLIVYNSACAGSGIHEKLHGVTLWMLCFTIKDSASPQFVWPLYNCPWLVIGLFSLFICTLFFGLYDADILWISDCLMLMVGPFSIFVVISHFYILISAFILKFASWTCFLAGFNLGYGNCLFRWFADISAQGWWGGVQIDSWVLSN